MALDLEDSVIILELVESILSNPTTPQGEGLTKRAPMVEYFR